MNLYVPEYRGTFQLCYLLLLDKDARAEWRPNGAWRSRGMINHALSFKRDAYGAIRFTI